VRVLAADSLNDGTRILSCYEVGGGRRIYIITEAGIRPPPAERHHEMNGLRSEALSPSHDREVFSCGVAALDNYLQRQASQDMRRHVAAVFVMVREGQPQTVLGYYTLASYAVETSGLPDGTARKLPR
jgi:hypothetical protein